MDQPDFAKLCCVYLALLNMENSGTTICHLYKVIVMEKVTSYPTLEPNP